MSSTNIIDAKIECTANPSCHMFFDWKGAGYRFCACDNTGKVEASKVGSVLYQKLSHISQCRLLPKLLKSLKLFDLLNVREPFLRGPSLRSN